MIQSMTGFGAAEKGEFKVEIRSVNQRFMEISMRLPQNLGLHEIPLKNLIKGRFSRGRFDVLVSLIGEGGGTIRVNVSLAKELTQALTSLKHDLALSGTVSVDTLANFKDLILSEDTEYGAESLFSAFGEALSRLEAMRVREGSAIVQDLAKRMDHIESMNEEVAQLCPGLARASKEKLQARLSTLFGEMKFDETRVLQEAAIMAERLDITEEIIRIRSHVAQLKKTMAEGDSVGRKVEFLLQELNREVNTIASKAADPKVSIIAVEMKTELEKMREQAQNLQ